MLNNIFKGLFDSSTQTIISPLEFLICIGTALLIGLMFALIYTYKSRYTKSFVVTLALMPSVVCVVIMMVNGNVGAGVAVAGAFSLVRFRSVPGTAKEIGSIFLAMGAGLAIGMGYIGYGLLFSLILGIANLIYVHIDFGYNKNIEVERIIRITMPENLDYMNIFDDIFGKYTKEHELIRVKTTNMGSLFKLTYNISLKDPSDEKQFIDEIRLRNGNLEISSSRQEISVNEL